MFMKNRVKTFLVTFVIYLLAGHSAERTVYGIATPDVRDLVTMRLRIWDTMTPLKKFRESISGFRNREIELDLKDRILRGISGTFNGCSEETPFTEESKNSSFCEECGICTILKAVRLVTHQLSVKVDISRQFDISEGEDSEEYTDPLNAYTKLLRRAVLQCALECAPVQLTLPDPLTFSHTVLPFHRFDFEAKEYAVYVPYAYSCPILDLVEPFCIPVHLWLKDICDRDFGDELQTTTAPKTTVCLYPELVRRIRLPGLEEFIVLPKHAEF